MTTSVTGTQDPGDGSERSVRAAGDAQLVSGARGLVAEFNRAGVLDAADVHVARRLSALAGVPTVDEVELAAAFAVRAVRAGSVCVELDRLRDIVFDGDTEGLPWPDPETVIAAVRASPLVQGSAAGPLRPLCLVDTDEGPLLYLDRYHRQENTVRRILDERGESSDATDERSDAADGPGRVRDALDRYFPRGDGPDRQRIAAAVAATTRTSVIAGGPGTGKTHTVARVLAVLRHLHGSGRGDAADDGPRIALCAPTGRAAAQLQSAVSAQSAEIGLPDTLSAVTIHRLLGWAPGSSSRFRHHATNRLPHDVVVVDETSMVSLTLMCRLLEAIRPDARLILVGDPDQLASVDAGAVLADLVARPSAARLSAHTAELIRPDVDAPATDDEPAVDAAETEGFAAGVVRLRRRRRFGGDIAAVADAVRIGDADAVVDLMRSGSSALSLVGLDELGELRADVTGWAVDLQRAATAGDVTAALDLLNRHRVLCAHREGAAGVTRWSRQVQDWVRDAGARIPVDVWYPGQPLLITANDPAVELYNGDTGVVVAGPRGEPVAAFRRGVDRRQVHPGLLADVQSVYAMTVHRSQGSQYRSVSIILPPEGSSLLTRELLYTAITRAAAHVRIVGSVEALRAGVDRKVLRASGLRSVPRHTSAG
ncbi:exodeoxyribonuclease V subunit alpha [Williamsia sterculiae]|uniref:RecBCD enzyme subunit RecD n=1 Tax=Williamsia sterculiae TaxID=1344003 RepID=A0A1N7H2F9_9NOCA|nr:exodeoxyribonuclease V subunit alpha [Williamsia sterculiae]SIS18993.1 DNA helicase/exodeoxyribonuclease V, alpha subunit [Williamsia sterculiae]